MDLPHDAHVVAADLLEGEAPRDHLNAQCSDGQKVDQRLREISRLPPTG